MAAPKSQTIARKSKVALLKYKDAERKSRLDAQKAKEYIVGQKHKIVMKGAWQCDMEKWQPSDVLEKKYNLKEGSIIRWFTFHQIPASYYIANCNGFFLSPDLVATYHIQLKILK